MEDKVLMKGNSVEEAVFAALEVLRASRGEVEFKVLKEAKGGVLGVFGAEQAEVEVWVKKSSQKFAQDFLQGILDRMTFMAIASMVSEDAEGVEMAIKGDDMGRIIGKEGATLDALQLLVSMAASKKEGRRVRVLIDAEGYREKQRRILEKMAREKAAEVKQAGKEVMLQPLSARERRIVHMVLKEDPKVRTYSEGEGEQRRLIIAPQ